MNTTGYDNTSHVTHLTHITHTHTQRSQPNHNVTVTSHTQTQHSHTHSHTLHHMHCQFASFITPKIKVKLFPKSHLLLPLKFNLRQQLIILIKGRATNTKSYGKLNKTTAINNLLDTCWHICTCSWFTFVSGKCHSRDKEHQHLVSFYFIWGFFFIVYIYIHFARK